MRPRRFAPRLGRSWLLLGWLILPLAGCQGAVASSPPPEEVVKAMLEKRMWGPPEQGGVVHAYHYQSLKIGEAREGNYLTDGVPANTQTAVYPVKVVVDVDRKFTDGVVKHETHDQSYVFFQDEFGDWTFRFIQNH